MTKLRGLMVTAMLLIIACSGKSTNDTRHSNTDTANTVGVFNLRQGSIEYFDSFASDNGAFANFMHSTQALSPTDLLNTYRKPLDTCSVFKSPGDAIFGVSGLSRYDFTNISHETSLTAGEILTVNSPAGTWMEVPRSQTTIGESIEYLYRSTDLPIAEPSQESLTLHITGDDFPAYYDIDIPIVNPIRKHSPSDGAIVELDTRFQWNAADSNNSFIRIVAHKNIGSERYEMDCSIEDDGEFTIPESTRLQLTELFKDYTYRMYRSAYTFERNDNSLLLVIHTQGTL